MTFAKTFLLINIFVMVFVVYGQIPPGSKAYLPPKQDGYKYPGPQKPFIPQGPGSRPGSKPGPKPEPRPGPGPRPEPRPGPRPPPRGEPGPNHVHIPGNPFDFEYTVNDINTSNDYNHKASSNGDEVKGEYRVQLPDGRMQVVRYVADWKTGYHADVSYEGQPRFPQGPGGRPGGGYKY